MRKMKSPKDEYFYLWVIEGKVGRNWYPAVKLYDTINSIPIDTIFKTKKLGEKFLFGLRKERHGHARLAKYMRKSVVKKRGKQL